MTNPTTVTVLGLGPMGHALASAFLAAGHRTTVWNRTPGKADDLLARGARAAGDPAEALAASELVVACVINYAAVHAILDPVADTLRGRTLVNLSADTPRAARDTAAWAAGHGVDYLDGAIMTPVPSIGTAEAVLLLSGAEPVYRAHEGTLAALGGTATYLGTDPGRAAAYDVALLDLFWTSVAGMTHAFALAAAEDVKAGELAPFAAGIGRLLPMMVEDHAARLDAARFDGDDANIVSATSTLEHIVATAEANGLSAGVQREVLALFRRAVEAGHGQDALAKLTEHV
ncbi:NAD(P)-dependent oxidoreductase [Actinophytocola xanthii]|uniref:Dehydrogenase n=1 Tax=Actinophytocola xanthii TaxID=1912961 RepID=A0A1Q8CUB7_9PSEU|nr:NAD(P)-binding domain-containing protein [Actinophytocola xanthii]OLF17955.1 dehydrogenase [Actinophytocola xanthii]